VDDEGIIDYVRGMWRVCCVWWWKSSKFSLVVQVVMFTRERAKPRLSRLRCHGAGGWSDESGIYVNQVLERRVRWPPRNWIVSSESKVSQLCV
jgi:hypothetical protein